MFRCFPELYFYLPDFFPAKNLQIFYTEKYVLRVKISLISIIHTSEFLFKNHITKDLYKLYLKRFLYQSTHHNNFHPSLPGTLGRSRQTSQSSWRARRLSVSGSTVASAPGLSALVAPPAALGPPLVRSALVNPQDSTPKWSHFVSSPTTRGKIKIDSFCLTDPLWLRCNFPFSTLAKFHVAFRDKRWW